MAYGLEETRSWQKRRAWRRVWPSRGRCSSRRGLPAGVRVVGGRQIGQKAGFDSACTLLWVGLRWPVVFILLVGALGVLPVGGAK